MTKAMKVLIGGALAILVLGVGGAIAASSGGTNADSAATSGRDASALTSGGPSDTTQPPSETPSPSASEASEPKPVTYSGRGKKVLKIKKPSGVDVALVRISGKGDSGNFAVWTLDSGLEENDLLVNTIGKYSGNVLMDIDEGDDTNRLKIEYDGNWKVVIKPITEARRWTDVVKGKGDDVLIYDGPDAVIAASHDGDSNFSLWAYGDNSDLLYNEIGRLKGIENTIQEGPVLLELNADGEWTLAADAG